MLFCFLISTVALANIFLPDQRIAVPADSRYRSIVRVNGFDEVLAPEECTGTLIGPDLVLTAAHCIEGAIDPNDYSSGVTFAFAEEITVISPFNRNSARVVAARYGTIPLYLRDANDWAVLQLSERLGDELGTLELDQPLPGFLSQLSDSDTWELPGFSVDRSGRNGLGLSVARECRPRNLPRPLIYHDCDSLAGASGGPLLRCPPGQPCRIAGIQHGEIRLRNSHATAATYAQYSDGHANVAVSVSQVLEAVRAFRR